jgi:hypothetical protein
MGQFLRKDLSAFRDAVAPIGAFLIYFIIYFIYYIFLLWAHTGIKEL